MNLNPLQEVEMLKPVLAEAAERFILPRFKNLKAEEIVKEGRFDEIVTVADEESSRFILAWCKSRFPGSFTEEELTDERFNYDALWSIDPLDGTDEFKHGKPGFCVQASLLARRPGGLYFPIAGLIYLPLERKFVYSTETEGPFLDDGEKRLIELPKTRDMAATQREQDPNQELGNFYEFLRQKGYEVQVLKTGGAGSTVARMLIGEHKPNLYIVTRRYSKEWDLSPSENAVARAGGWISDLYGNRFSYNRSNCYNERGFVVAVGLDKTEVISRLTKFGIEKLLNSKS